MPQRTDEARLYLVAAGGMIGSAARFRLLQGEAHGFWRIGISQVVVNY